MIDDDPFVPLDDEEEFNPYAAPRAGWRGNATKGTTKRKNGFAGNISATRRL